MKYEYLKKKMGFWEKRELRFMCRRCNIRRDRQCKHFPSCHPCRKWID